MLHCELSVRPPLKVRIEDLDPCIDDMRAWMIQCAYRQYMLHKEIARRIHLKRAKRAAALVLQRAYRRYKSRDEHGEPAAG